MYSMMPIPIILYSGVYGSGNIWIDIAYSFFAIPILIWAIYELWSIYKEEREDRKFEREAWCFDIDMFNEAIKFAKEILYNEA